MILQLPGCPVGRRNFRKKNYDRRPLCTRLPFIQVDRELRQCGGRNGRGRLAAVHPRLFPLLDGAMKSLGALRNAKRREEELFGRLRVVGQGATFLATYEF